MKKLFLSQRNISSVRKLFRKNIRTIVIAATIMVGITLIINTKAATLTASVEVGGSVTAPAISVSPPSSASGGSAVRFGQANSSVPCQTYVIYSCRYIGTSTGVTYWLDNTFPNKKVHVLRIDLANKRLAVRASTYEERKQTPSAFAAALGSIATINGDFFSTTTYLPVGLAIGQGVQWPGSIDKSGSITYIACKDQAECIIDDDYSTATQIDPQYYRQTVGGSGILKSVDRNQRWSAKPGDTGCPVSTGNITCGAELPRTAVGLSNNKQAMIWVMVEGGQTNLSGLSLYDLTTVLERNGAAYAINLDGGGSSGMILEGKRVNGRQLSEPNERVVANSLNIIELPN